MTVSSSGSVKSSGIAALACTVCRKQHLKCDAGKPSCARCTESQQVCFYEPSRRGGRRKKHRSVALESPLQSHPRRPAMRSSQSDTTGFVECVTVNPISLPITPTSSQELLPTSNMSHTSTINNNLLQHTPRQSRNSPPSEGSRDERRASGDGTQENRPPPPLQQLNDPAMSFYHHLDPGLITQTINNSALSLNTHIQPSSDGDRLLRLYYENFHNAHPFLVPSSVFTSRNYPPYLRRMVDYAGSHYAPSGPNAQLQAEVATDMMTITENSTCMVQTLLIYSILLFFNGDLDAASKTFDRCTQMALDLGMHRTDFASARQLDNPIEGESLRRTWWEIYVTDVFMGIPPKTMNLRCSSTPPKVCLPCEEAFYNGRLDIPQPHQVLEFKRRVISTGDVTFSSFSYRIEAATILGRVLLLNQLKNTSHDQTQSIENALLSWSNHLPAEKLEIVDSYGNIDEMMFQAHMIIALASMLLHLPRSNLYSLLADVKDPFLPFSQNHPLSTSTVLIQGIKATDASRRISDCISLCPNVPKHTPFVIPALVLCGFIQLATSRGHPEECFEHHYNRVTLVLGCLKSARRMWRMAESEYDRLRCCASELVADAMDRMNALPLSQTIPYSSSSMPSAGELGGDMVLVSPGRGNADSAMPRFDPLFLDPVCYDYSLFSALPDFHSS
ncbi:Ff.00g013690.m01.CDS01 [Fusarium sp. VM40]|nr:Ff.00g013690.m01.CDS01 [Fusarium sp. VM40]